MSIATEFGRLLKIPSRLKEVGIEYVTSLMQDVGKRSLTAASRQSGLNVSQFSRFLSGHQALAFENLNRLARRRLSRLLPARRSLVKGTPWRIALIIDATLHERSSRHLDNAQRFNHGQGWVIGHQWTNVILVINGEVVPLPPIAFLTEEKCIELGQEYKTESERILEFLSVCNWKDLLPGVDPSEIVVLSDSGYDNKALQRFFLEQGWDFVGSLKKTRSVKTTTQAWQSVSELFRRTRKIGPWQTVRHQASSGKKRRELRVRTLLGLLKGVNRQVRLLATKKPNGENLYLACSRSSVEAGAISRTYRLRWTVELFHRDVKNYLGLEDAGLTRFDAIHAHVLWVYCTYLLLAEIGGKGKTTLDRRRSVERALQSEEVGRVLQLNSRFDGKAAVQNYYSQVRERLKTG